MVKRKTEPKVKGHGYAAVLAGDFGRIAAFLANKALQVETDSSGSPDRFLAHDAYVNSSIIASVAFLEAVANDVWSELGMGASGRTWPERKRVFSRLWTLGIPRTAAYPVLEKYQVALVLTGQEPFDRGASPYQDAQVLISLRNELIHYEPTFQPVEGPPADEQPYPPHKLVGRLKDRFHLNPMCAPHAPMWPYKLLGAGCASWAVMSTVIFVEAFADRFPIRHISRFLTHMTGAIRELATRGASEG